MTVNTDKHELNGTVDPMAASTSSGTSPELTGGQGFTFEDAAAGIYATALLCQTTAPGLPGRIVTHVSVQQGSFGHPLDDLIVQGRGADLISITLSLQVKRKLIITASETNSDFRETIERAHKTVSDTGFVPGLDRVGAIVGEIADASKRAFETLCEWARTDSSAVSFSAKIRTEGVAGAKLPQFESVRRILSAHIPQDELDAAAHKLLAHFVLIRFDLLTEGATTEAAAVSSIANILAPADRTRADDLWRRLLALVRVSQGHAAVFDRKTLVARLNGAFRLSGAPSLVPALRAIEQEARLAASEIDSGISGLNVPRDAQVQAVIDATKTAGFVQVTGMPGAGKSVVLRLAVERLLQSGPVLFLKSDRLQGTTWLQYASASGFHNASLDELLVELRAAGSGVMFIDGIDRIEVAHQGIVTDVLNTILMSAHLTDWCTVATVRDTGMEPLRTWLPSTLFDGGVRTLKVNSFDDDEARSLAQAKPALQSLLFGPPAVRSVVRRPFFAAILAKESDAENATANSEVDLAALWWKRGGYAADPRRVGYRRTALMDLAKAGAHQLGRRIPVHQIDAQVLDELEADGIIRTVRVGHSVQFVHDIFFEWAFLQYLISKGDDWARAIQEIGEPPALGRTVELLSQTELVHQENWGDYLAALEADQSLRSQWLRAWLVGPFSLETFERHAVTFDRIVFDREHSRVGKLVVWYQAEKTQPNTGILERAGVPEFDVAERMLYADMLGYPADVASWIRFCSWLLDHAADLYPEEISDVVAAFGVWQNGCARYPNHLSDRIVHTCLGWLYHLERQLHRREFRSDNGAWGPVVENALDRNDLEALDQSLRALILTASTSQQALAALYIRDLQQLERLPRDTIKAVWLHAQSLAIACPKELVDLTLAAVCKPLPIAMERSTRNLKYRSFYGHSDWDWSQLSIENDDMFFPAAPTREPFHSLMEHAPHEGRRLIREISNHAISSWRQLHRLSNSRRGTPIPIPMHFPWGKHVFWGDFQRYMGARGNWGPSVVNAGLMALEAWAFRQLDIGIPPDDVLKQVLDGHRSVGALAIGTAVVLHAQQCSESSLPIITNQRVWQWEINRHVQDSGQNANLIGFKPYEIIHVKAVQESNSRPVRKSDIRSLATLILIKGGELSVKASAAIQRFPDALPFDYVQERNSEKIVGDLSQTAKIWAELGKRENYRAEMSEDQTRIIISVDNPSANGPEVEAIRTRHTEMARHLRILNWAYSYFKEGKLNDALSIDDSVSLAKELDSPELFEKGYASLNPAHQKQSAVAAVAAVVIAEEAAGHLQWAVGICVRASRTPEVHDELFTRQMRLMFHPVLFAANGLGACFKMVADEDIASLHSLLTELVAHYYEDISIAALKGLLSAWNNHPLVAWDAMRLASELARVELRYESRQDETQAQRLTSIQSVVISALDRIADGINVKDALPVLPTPWIRGSTPEPASKSKSLSSGRRRRPAGWELNPIRVDVHFLRKVIEIIPVEVAVTTPVHADHFLDWCEGLAAWTLERIAPSWARNPGDLDDNVSHYYMWKLELYRFLAKVSLYIPTDDSMRRFLEPAMAASDKPFGELCFPFTSYLTCEIAP